MSSENTSLDMAHAAMQAEAEADALRLRFYERLADSELYLLLREEPVGDAISPQVFPVEDCQYVLVFDTADRLADFTGQEAPFVAMSGRKIAAMLDGQGLGLGVNLGVAPSSFLVGPEGVDWLVEILANQAEARSERPMRVLPPFDLDEDLIAALDHKLTSAAGLAAAAYLVGVEYEGGAQANLLAFIDALKPAEAALQQAVSEVMSFRAETAVLDVGFFRASEAICADFAKAGFRIEIAKAQEAASDYAPSAPGMDPGRPPVLK